MTPRSSRAFRTSGIKRFGSKESEGQCVIPPASRKSPRHRKRSIRFRAMNSRKQFNAQGSACFAWTSGIATSVRNSGFPALRKSSARSSCAVRWKSVPSRMGWMYLNLPREKESRAGGFGPGSSLMAARAPDQEPKSRSIRSLVPRSCVRARNSSRFGIRPSSSAMRRISARIS